MKKFKYKIEAYLKFLRFQEEAKLKDFKKIEAYRMNLRQKYQWMEDEMKKAWTSNSQLGKGVVNVHFVHDNNKFLELLKAQMKRLSIEISQVQLECEKRYREFLAAQLKVKKVEHHREIKKKEYDKMRKKHEQKQLDEMNSTRQGGYGAKSV